VVILLLGFLLSRCGSSSDPFSTDPQQVFVRVNTSAYSEMSEAVTNREPLMRGASLSVIQGADETDGADWAKIVHGPLKDRYVRKSALSAREPPDLVRLIGQTWTVGPVQVNVREEPSASAAALTQLAPATRLTVVGVTANGWAEVTLPTGAAAYVHARLLRAPAPAKETVILSSPPLAERPRTAAASPAVPDPQENSPAGRGESGSPPADDNRPTVITSPDWLRRPSGEEVARYYPDRAMRLGLEGRAVLSCEVSAAGVLVDCSVTSEEPADGGFGEAALRMTRLFKMRPMTRDGRLVGGSRVRIPINFRLPNGGT
jgi:TonB family protein